MQQRYRGWALFEALVPAGSSPAGQEMRGAEVGHPVLEHSPQAFWCFALANKARHDLGQAN